MLRTEALETYGLPSDTETEKLVLGAAMSGDTGAAQALVNTLEAEDFALEAHKRIFAALQLAYNQSPGVDRVQVAGILRDRSQLDSVGGIMYLVALDESLPKIYGYDGYLKTLREKSILRRAAITLRALADECCIPGASSATLERAANSVRLIEEKRLADRKLQQLGEFLEKREDGLNTFLMPKANSRVFPTFWPSLSAKLSGGFRPSELIVVGGRPGAGKSALAGQIALHVAGRGFGTVVFPLEMSADEVWRRMVSQHASIPLSVMREGMEAGFRQRAQGSMSAIAEMPLWLDDSMTATAGSMHAAIRLHMASGRKTDVVIIDYLGLIQSPGRTENRNQEIAAITRALKVMAREFQVAVVLLAQLNRENAKQDRAPELSDLRDSGAIEQDADIVIFPHVGSKERRVQARGERFEAQLILAKQRNGPIGIIPVQFNPQLVRFEEIE